jgi:hypothetical protein
VHEARQVAKEDLRLGLSARTQALVDELTTQAFGAKR